MLVVHQQRNKSISTIVTLSRLACVVFNGMCITATWRFFLETRFVFVDPVTDNCDACDALVFVLFSSVKTASVLCS
jgi:hypothetical protein